MAVRARPIEFIKDLPANNRPGVMVFVLGCAYPRRIFAKELMETMGLPLEADPVSSFVSLCIDFKNVNRGLKSYGWQAVRSNGTPDAQYRLRPIGRS